MPWQKMLGWARLETGRAHLIIEFGGRPITFCRSLDFPGEIPKDPHDVPTGACKTCLRYYEAHRDEVCRG